MACDSGGGGVVCGSTSVDMCWTDAVYVARLRVCMVYYCELNDFNEWHLGVHCITTTTIQNINNNKRKIEEIYLHMKKYMLCR